jgi:4-aminobutyrate aminotransferase-like enzyme
LPIGHSAKTIFCNSGFEAVEAALKTAMLATGKRGVIAFEGAYHGLGYGALNATHREHFRTVSLAASGVCRNFVPFPKAKADLGNRKLSETSAAESEKKLRAAPPHKNRRHSRRADAGARRHQHSAAGF